MGGYVELGLCGGLLPLNYVEGLEIRENGGLSEVIGKDRA